MTRITARVCAAPVSNGAIHSNSSLTVFVWTNTPAHTSDKSAHTHPKNPPRPRQKQAQKVNATTKNGLGWWARRRTPMTGTTGTPQYPTQQQHTNQQAARPAQRGSTVATVRNRAQPEHSGGAAPQRGQPRQPVVTRPAATARRDPARSSAMPQHRDAAPPYHGTPHRRDGYPPRAQPQPQHRR